MFATRRLSSETGVKVRSRNKSENQRSCTYKKPYTRFDKVSEQVLTVGGAAVEVWPQ